MTIKAFRFIDDKSDKFWAVETLDSDLVVRYGKTGTIGKYQIKEFGDEEEATHEAAKLMASKTRKGYLPYPEFDPLHQYYINDQEMGLHRLTSHPAFRACFPDDFYYDCNDEEAPFGSDEGSDTLAFLEDAFRANQDLDFAAFPAHLVGNDWGMAYIPAIDADVDLQTVRQLLETDELNLTQSDMVTYATAFAQIKITGKIDAILRQRALNALTRIAIVAQLCNWGEPSEIQQQMHAKLKSFGDYKKTE